MEPYASFVSQNEVKSILVDFFENNKSGRLSKLIWFMKNKPDQTRLLLQEIYGNIPNYDDVNEFLYNLYYPNCKKICEVCGKPLDGFSIHKGYYQSFKHKMCKKSYVLEKFSSYHDLVGRNDFKSRAAIKTLSSRDDIILLIEDFKKEYPEFNHYTNYDCLYLWIMFDNLNNISQLVPFCECGKHVKVEPSQVSIKEPKFSSFCYDKQCKNSHMTKCLKDTYFKSTGYSNPSQNPNIKKKKETTFLKHYGNWNEFIKQTLGEWCSRQGIQNVSQLENVKNKKLQTILNKGYSGWDDYLSKIIKDFCTKVGICNVSQLDIVKDKKIESYFEKTGYQNPFQNPEVISKIKEYWIQHPDEYKTSHQKVSESLKRNKEKINHFRKGYTGIMEFDVLNEIEQSLTLKIYRQVSCMQYFIDGYISEYGIAIEFDEPSQHDSKDQIEYDLTRQNEIQDYIKLIFVRISMNDWLKDKNECIERIRKAIEISKTLNIVNMINFECLTNKRYRIRKLLK